MPQAFASRRLKPLGDGARGLLVLAQQKVAHGLIGQIGAMHLVEQRAGYSARGLGKVHEPVDGLGELGGAARAMAHHACDELGTRRPPARAAANPPTWATSSAPSRMSR